MHYDDSTEAKKCVCINTEARSNAPEAMEV